MGGGGTPSLRLERYFVGRAKAWGLFQDRFGRVRRRFDVDVEGRLDGETLILVEDFAYDDGERERRTWRIEATEADSYRGQAEGIIGQAAGRIDGNALTWSYDFALPLGQRTLKVRFEDQMFLQDDDILMCLSKVTKFGLRLGDVTMVFRKRAEDPRLERQSAGAQSLDIS